VRNYRPQSSRFAGLIAGFIRVGADVGKFFRINGTARSALGESPNGFLKSAVRNDFKVVVPEWDTLIGRSNQKQCIERHWANDLERGQMHVALLLQIFLHCARQSIFKLEFVSFTCARKVFGVLDQT